MVYPRKLITPPAEEPISLTEAKLHCQIEHSADDALITEKLAAARQHIENHTSRALVTQTWDIYLPCFPCGEIRLPFGNLQSVGEFEWISSTGVTSTWTVSGGDLLSGSTIRAHINAVEEPACIGLAYGQVWPSDTLKSVNPIRVRITCGYGAASAVPSPIKAAILLQVRHLYDNRGAVIIGNTASADSKPLAMGVDALLANYRLWSF